MKFLTTPCVMMLLLLTCVSSAQVTVTLEPAKDNTLFEDLSGSLSNGAGIYLFVGQTLTGTNRRALLQWDVAGNIPLGATIQSVQLDMFVSQTLTGSSLMTLHAASTNWGEGSSNSTAMGGGGGAPAQPGDATWLHTFFSTGFWSTAGGDFNPTPSGSATGGSLFTTVTWASTSQMVADAQSWLDTPATNYGWLIDGGTNLPKKFESRESGSASNRPRLTVTYVPLASVTSVGAGCAGSNSQTLALSANGLPTLGNLGFGFNLTGGIPGNAAFLYAASSASTVGAFPLSANCLVFLDLPSALVFIQLGVTPLPAGFGPGGSAFFPLAVPNVVGFGGLTFSVQALGIDPIAPAGVTSSNALDVVFGL